MFLRAGEDVVFMGERYELFVVSETHPATNSCTQTNVTHAFVAT